MLRTQDILPRLRAARRTQNGWRALCPAHDDQKTSLSISEGENGKVLLHCHAGCSFEEVVAALGDERGAPLDMKPKRSAKQRAASIEGLEDTWGWWRRKTAIPEEWWQANEVDVVDGKVSFSFPLAVKKLRSRRGSYYWEHPDGIPIPPLWPSPDGELPGSIILCEGETDCATLRYCGYPAFGVTKGAKARLPVALFRALAEKGIREVTIIFDLDDAGRDGAARVAQSAVQAGLQVYIATLPDSLTLSGGKDANDLWHQVGYDREAFRKVVDDCLARRQESSQSSHLVTHDLTETRPMTIQWAPDVPPADSSEGEGLWGNYIRPGSTHLLSGQAGVGKTTLLYNVGVHGAQGTAFGGIPFKRVIPVIYMDLESPEYVFRKKLELVCDGERPPGLGFVRQLDDIEGQLPQVEELIRAHGVELLILDTVSAAFRTVDENDNAEANRQGRLMRGLVARTGCAVILVHHLGKSPLSSGIYKARGASARAGFVDVVLNLEAVGEDTVRLDLVKSRWTGGRECLTLRKVGEDQFEAVETSDSSDATMLMRCQGEILKLVSDGLEWPRKDIVAALPRYSQSTVVRALSSLVQTGKLARPARGLYVNLSAALDEIEF